MEPAHTFVCEDWEAGWCGASVVAVVDCLAGGAEVPTTISSSLCLQQAESLCRTARCLHSVQHCISNGKSLSKVFI